MGRHHTRPSLATSLDLQELGADLRIYGETDDLAMRNFNPSLAFHNGDLKISLRSCNFAVRRHGSFYFRDGNAYSKTDVLFGDLDPETLQVSNIKKLNLDKDSPTRVLVAGLEDVRLFSRKDGLHAIGFESDRLTRSLHNESATMAEYVVKGNELKYIRTLEKPDSKVVEKNWSPTDVATSNFDFTYSPTQVWKAGKVYGYPTKSQIHGGSQLIKQKDGTFLSIVHQKIADVRLGRFYDRFVYFTYLARHDKNGLITHLTPRFKFGTHENIEFASGLVEHDDHFIISLGIRDAKYAIAKIRKDKLVSLLEPAGSLA